VVEEPHSFKVTIDAQHDNKPYRFGYEQAEARVAMSDAQLKANQVEVLTAGPARIRNVLQLIGEVRFNEDRTVHVVPRLSGIVQSVSANAGDRVRKGQVLAAISSQGLADQRAELLAAQKRLALARTIFEREKKLWEDKISAEQDYLQARTALQEAEIAEQNARQKLASLGGQKLGGDFTRYELRSPIDGVVVDRQVEPGQTVATTWSVTPPVTENDGPYDLTASAAYTLDGAERTISTTSQVRTVVVPPVGTTYASDLPWISASNGWGPVELDRANGEAGTGDGPQLKLQGVTYDKGLGAHAVSNVRYYLGARCETFTADVGVDDYQPTRGSITFAVRADGATVASTGVMRPDTPTVELTANVDGAMYVDLVVGDAGDGNGNDHGDWADAKFTCSGDGVGSGGGSTGDPLLPKTALSAVDASSEDAGTGGGKEMAVDGDTSTQWHSAWSEVATPAGYPHHITVDTGAARQISGLVYTPRQDGGTNGIIKGYQVFVSTDGVTWGSAVKTGEFPTTTSDPMRVDFTATPGRFVKLVATSSRNGQPFASAAELDIAVHTP